MIETGVEDCVEKRRGSPNALLFLYPEPLHRVERVKAASIRLRAFGFQGCRSRLFPNDNKRQQRLRINNISGMILNICCFGNRGTGRLSDFRLQISIAIVEHGSVHARYHTTATMSNVFAFIFHLMLSVIRNASIVADIELH